MVLEIKNLVVDAQDLGELDTKVFYFISTTSFVNSVKNVFPAELAIAKFSLKEGIFDGKIIGRIFLERIESTNRFRIYRFSNKDQSRRASIRLVCSGNGKINEHAPFFLATKHRRRNRLHEHS